MSCLRLQEACLVMLHSEGACVSKLSPFAWLGAVIMAGHVTGVSVNMSWAG